MKNIKKINIEDGIVLEEDRNFIININKFLVSLLEKYEILGSEIIEYSDEDIHNLLMFLQYSIQNIFHQYKLNLYWCFFMFKKCFIINKKSKKATKNDLYMIKINKEF